MEWVSITWEMFADTGDIDAYLLYKTVSEKKKESESEIWEPSEKMVL